MSVLDKIVQLESKVSGDEKQWKSADGSLILDNYQIYVASVRALLSQAVKILSVGHSVLLTKRRGLLKPFLDQKFHFLLKPTNPVTQDLLGPDLEQKISDGTRVVDVGQKLFPPHPKVLSHPHPRSSYPPSRREQYRGRGGRHHSTSHNSHRCNFGRHHPYPQPSRNSSKNQYQYTRLSFNNRGHRGSHSHQGRS